METQQPVEEVPVKNNRTLWIIVGVVILLTCCCVVIGIVGYFNYITIRSVETQVSPVDDFMPSPEDELATPTTEPDSTFDLPGLDEGPGEPPEGGLGNEILRNDTWQYVAAAAVGQGCDQPVGADTEIEVLQQPSNGVWVEKWTVACASGDSYAYEVEFILDDTGATFNIKSLP